MKTDRREIHERVSMAVAQAVKLAGPVNQTNAPVIREIAPHFRDRPALTIRQLAVLSRRG
jgi:hypothetical protein